MRRRSSAENPPRKIFLSSDSVDLLSARLGEGKVRTAIFFLNAGEILESSRRFCELIKMNLLFCDFGETSRSRDR